MFLSFDVPNKTSYKLVNDNAQNKKKAVEGRGLSVVV
jgi:hypothetical protein